MIRVAVTGARGFVGGHVLTRMRQVPAASVVAIGREEARDPGRLRALLADVDAVVHLAGVNRGNGNDIEDGNVRAAEQLIDALPATPPHVVFASSTRRDRDDPYGRSKRAAESILTAAAQAGKIDLTILVIPNVFGPGCRPFYNSVVATFCYQLTHGEQPVVHEDRHLELIAVTDLVDMVATQLADPPSGVRTVTASPAYQRRVWEILDTLRAQYEVHFRERHVPAFADPCEEHLYRTLVTYAEPEDHRYRPDIRRDARGYLFEAVKKYGGNQLFFSTTTRGVTRGNHFHTRKYEKFCVVRGEAVIRLRRVGSDDVLEYRVRGDDPEIVDIPLFYAHSIENVGEDELLTLFWSSELFDPDDADTFPEPVLR